MDRDKSVPRRFGSVKLTTISAGRTWARTRRLSGPTTPFRALERPLWTENKAKLVAAYLRFFVFITRRGAYIDAFTGPQEPTFPETWSAKLVLENQPAFISASSTAREFVRSNISSRSNRHSSIGPLTSTPATSMRSWTRL
jgi:hypothetical protein